MVWPLQVLELRRQVPRPLFEQVQGPEQALTLKVRSQ
jgi:hypothetical protein